MTATKNSNGSIVVSEADHLAAKEREIRRTYPRVLKGTIRKETHGAHAGKITVVIKCATKGCGNTRRVATSDLFQVRYCPDCTRNLRNAKRREARADGKPTKKTKAHKAKAQKVKASKSRSPLGDGLPVPTGKARKVRKAPKVQPGDLQPGPIAHAATPERVTVS